MLSNVPQFIDIEDKIVGPLTAKQLGWLAGGGVVLMVLWNYLDLSAFIIAAIITAGTFGALAFYRPYNQSLIMFIFSAVFFVTRPKLYVWRRFSDTMSEIGKKGHHQKIATQRQEKKKIDSDKLKEISGILDSQNH
jgi:hypothetical protein